MPMSLQLPKHSMLSTYFDNYSCWHMYGRVCVSLQALLSSLVHMPSSNLCLMTPALDRMHDRNQSSFNKLTPKSNKA